MWELVRWNNVLGNATMGVIYGRPDCFDQISVHDDPIEATLASFSESGNLCIRKVGESNQLFRAETVIAYYGLVRAKQILPHATDDTLAAIVSAALHDSGEDEYWRTIEDKVERKIRKGMGSL